MTTFSTNHDAYVYLALQRLNLANVTRLQSTHLSGLLTQSDEGSGLQEPPRLEELILNNTAVSDDATEYIAACTSLEVLELAGTKFTSKHAIVVETSTHIGEHMCARF